VHPVEQPLREGSATSVETTPVVAPVETLVPGSMTRALVPVFVAASFLSATLLFLIQPMAAKLLLPVFGGGPSIWNTSMVFFQVFLVAGYAYAHFATLLPRRTHLLIHVGVLAAALLVLPFHVPQLVTGASGSPSLLLLGSLTIMVGAPFFLLSTMAPVLQRWFAWSDHPRAHDPYFLYAAGNAGSVLGLLSYPFLVEPLLDLRNQALVWTAGYVLLVSLAAATAVVVWRFRPSSAAVVAGLRSVAGPVPSLRRVAGWGGWTFVPSALMLAATAYITTDIAPVPLLWVVPLTVYLATFIVAFSSVGPALVRPASVTATALALLAGLQMVGMFMVPVPVTVGLHVALLGAVGTAFHGYLVADRPPAEHLTRFYLAMSVGGALGGSFVALVAPLVFPTLLEYAILLVAAVVALERNGRFLDRGTPVTRLLSLLVLFLAFCGAFLWADALPAGRLLLFAALALVAAASHVRNVIAVTILLGALAMSAYTAASSLHIERTFFGVHRVVIDGENHELVHGSTVHGVQSTDPELRGIPMSYYHPDGPLGDLMRLARGSGPLDVGVVGLGTGAVAAYGQTGDRIVFYEIDPAVLDIAQNDRLFTYLTDTPANIEVVLGDGRLTLEASDAQHDMLIVDAFSSDAIPVHLLTQQAIELYLSRVTDAGTVAIHISNRNLDLAPVVAAIAEQDGVDAWVRRDRNTPDDSVGRAPSEWIVLAGPSAGVPDGWEDLSAVTPRRVLWTDSHSDVLRILRRGG
jgi:hypothetical protein